MADADRHDADPPGRASTSSACRPTPEEVEAFVADTSPDAFAKVVDRLLASPRFGERWGRHWLDVARFAESSGKANMIYPQAWRYRDWVIAAFNADKPYDRFVREQIAGDLLPAEDDRRAGRAARSPPASSPSAARPTTPRTASSSWSTWPTSRSTSTSQAFLGLTVACARCHDHKFDPIPQRDYYALSGIFQSTQTCYGHAARPGPERQPVPPDRAARPAPACPRPCPDLTPERRAALEAQLAELIKTRDALTPEENFTPKGFQTRTRLAMLRFRLASYRPDGTPRTYAMGVRERFEPVDSPLYVRGELDQPGELVPRGPGPGALPRDARRRSTAGSGRRELADWLASRENPLTARVMVNRVWLHLFGRGLVPDARQLRRRRASRRATPSCSTPWPSRSWTEGWSVKALIRRIVAEPGLSARLGPRRRGTSRSTPTTPWSGG